VARQPIVTNRQYVLQAIELASAIEQTRAAQDIIAADQRSLELVRVSQEAGKSAGLDVLTAESQLASDRALMPPLQQQASVARHALAVLAGKTAADWRAPDFDFKVLALPREIPLTLPSELLRRRPDIAQSEAQLHATSAAIGIAAAQLYPAVSLSATWTKSSVGGALFAHPASAWNIAADALGPVFNGGTLRAQRDAAVYGYAAQLSTYRQTVLLAFAQVADGLQALANDAALVDAQRKAFDAAQATLDLTQQSYQAGQASFPQVIESQRLFQQARLGFVRANAQRYLDTLQLFVALGGAEPSAGVPRTAP
jgi:NodT family efflux transporter outer membrane factor (OMF) lipoprotein